MDEKSFAFHGKFYDIRCIVEPKPIQKPHPPLWFGCWGKRMLRLAGRFGDGWIPTGPRAGGSITSPQEYARGSRRIREELEKRSYPSDAFRFACTFGPYNHLKKHLNEIQDFSAVGLNCYVLEVSILKHPSALLRSFSDLVIPCF